MLTKYIYIYIYIYIVGRVAQSVKRLTTAGLSGIESRWGRDFPPVQTGPGPTQPPLKWVPGLFRG